ncbi:hypothetical protein QUA56_08290 [Microcoleus sp. N3A4]|uniref:hypothetical protein n=1 Tax=Microcoleus sp. N3A4 TaxID=3055379 RepID=UPI002FD17BAD
MPIVHLTDKSRSIQGLARCLSLVTKNEWDAVGLKTEVYAIENTILCDLKHKMYVI